MMLLHVNKKNNHYFKVIKVAANYDLFEEKKLSAGKHIWHSHVRWLAMAVASS